MSVTAQSIIDRVRLQIMDAGGTRWTDAELLKWVSDGQRALVAYSPGISSTTASSTLVAGTKQTIPSDGHMLFTVVRNLTSGGSPGRATRIVSRELLDGQDPNWHTSTASPMVQNYVFDPQEPRKFYVYPPNDGTGYVELVYSVLPADLTALSDTLVVMPIYQTALFDYVMFRAHQKDSDFAAGQTIAAAYLQLFMAYVTEGEAGTLTNNPNLQLMPPNPSVKGSAK